MSKILCIFHGGCNDGFGAAWVVRRYFGEENVEFYPATYQTPPPDVSGREVVIVDFSFKRDVMKRLQEDAATLTLLDHHKSAFEDLQPMLIAGWLGNEGAEAHTDEDAQKTNVFTEFANRLKGLRRFYRFDMEHSGAVLAWMHYFPGTSVPPLLKHIEDRDIRYTTMSETSRLIGVALYSHEQKFSLWDQMMDQVGCDILEEEGETLERAKTKDLKSILKVSQRRMFILGHNVPVCNAPHMYSSEGGHLMGAGEPFAATYSDLPDGRKFELRSAEDGMDVSDIAKRYGGGGHKHAAGFKIQFCQADHHIAYPIKVFEYQDMTTGEKRWFAGMRAQDVGLFMDWDTPKSNARELSEEELDSHTVVLADGKTATYRERLMALIATPDIKFPQPFAEPLPEPEAA